MQMKIMWQVVCNDFKKRVCNERGTWVAIAAAVIGGGAAIGGAYMQSSAADKATESQEAMFEREFAEKKKPATFIEAPRFAETDAAREGWWSKLKEWGQQPGYGAIAPDWDAIWEQSKGKVSDYWRGTATTPGVMSRIKASAARRGVSDSPAFGVLATRAGAEESGQLKDIATTQATKRAAFSESGRRNWLQSMTQMSNLQVPGAWDKYGGMNVAQPSYMGGAGLGDVVGDVGSGIAGLGMQYYQNQWLEQERDKERSFMKELYGTGSIYGSTKPASITGTKQRQMTFQM